MGTLFPDFKYLQTALFWCKSLEIIMRILAAQLMIGLASAAEAERASPDLAQKVMTQGEIIAHRYDKKNFIAYFHIRYKGAVYLCYVPNLYVASAPTGCKKISFSNK